jgi:predicted RNA methylase
VAVPAPRDGPFLERFSGFADLYDSQRPSAPARLGPLLARYAQVERPVVVDLGSGTGLSTRWAAGWAGRVIAVEPNDDMRAVALTRGAVATSFDEVGGDVALSFCWRVRLGRRPVAPGLRG